jgi:hypothetical protein
MPGYLGRHLVGSGGGAVARLPRADQPIVVEQARLTLVLPTSAANSFTPIILPAARRAPAVGDRC